ncbi:MAG: ImmA/IrrE family metallo-endopeptidase [Planctomycetaceae bacterium]|nr:ImmA/IrrE family metallo-endopeptidase [Planctomycetaceae bacterium]
MRSQENWASACDRVVAEMLSEGDVAAPPVDALLLGLRLEHRLAWDAEQSARGRLVRRDGETTILLRPEVRPERVQWAAAHELGESVAWRVCQLAGSECDDVSPRQREQLANQFAQRLLLPTAWFQQRCRELDGDLVMLKTAFSTASYELIACRFLDLATPCVVTIWDHARQTRRCSNLTAGAPPLTCSERDVWQTTHATAATTDFQSACGRIRGWAIHEPHWKREITCWEIAESDDA